VAEAEWVVVAVVEVAVVRGVVESVESSSASP
jgi:hypothetical protein